MVKYHRTGIAAKIGVNYVRSLVEAGGCLFHKIEQESDLGVDAHIELVKGEQPMNVLVAAQIRSGQSYYNASSDECLIPIGTHREYWSGYPLPVIGVVYVPSLSRAHWLDLKHALAQFPTASVIRFAATEANRLDVATFKTRFVPRLLGEVPIISLDEALALLGSGKADESYMGLIVLFRRYPNRRETWAALVDYFATIPSDDIPPVLIYYLAHIPWHGDIAYGGEPLARATRDYAGQLLDRFGRKEILKLLSFIDTENMISRGAIGQSVEAVISSLSSADAALESIARDLRVELFARECAVLILAMHLGRAAIPSLRALAESGSWYAAEVATHVEQNGQINPYA